MPRPSLFGLLLLFIGLLSGCTSAPLARPAILGASASAGFGCETTGSDGKPYLVDMEAVYQATVTGWHSDPVFLADAGFYANPRKIQQEQAEAALARNPSIVVAIDYLFWSVYGSRDPSMTADAVERDRLDALEQALAQLDRFHGPVIIGDIPDMRAATARMLSERNVPPPAQLDAFNRRIRQWAAQRPPDAPAVVIPAAELGVAIQGRAGINTSTGPMSPEQAAALLQDDHLHPTPSGLAVLLREGLAGLAAKGVIKPDAYRADLAEVTARLAGEARAADSRREPGLWTLLSVKGKLSDFGDAIEKKDCAGAAELFDQVMEKASRLKKSPHEMAGLYVSFTLMGYRSSCANAPQAVRRWRDKLDPLVERPVPDPWPLELWTDFNRYIDEEPRTVERALRLKRSGVALSKDYDDVFESAARSVKYTDPAVFLELGRPWRDQLNSDIKIARGIAEYWTNFSKKPEWAGYVERTMKSKLAWAINDAERKQIEARRAEFADPKTTIVSSRAMTLDSIAALERALRITGQTATADTVKSEFEALAEADEVAAARDRVEKEAAKELAKPVEPQNRS